MPKKKRKTKAKQRQARILIAGATIVALAAAGAVIIWKTMAAPAASVAANGGDPTTAAAFCASGDDETAKNGVFCSADMGIKFNVPSLFANKLAKASNYQVFRSPLDSNAQQSAGMSEVVYEASISGNDNVTLTVAQEPIRTGYVDVSHALQNTYFDQATGELTLVKAPTRYYNSATDSFTTSGNYSKGGAVPSFVVHGTRFFRGLVGDAGQTKNTYFGIVKNKIIKITLNNMGYIGDPANDPTTIDATNLFNELDNDIKAITLAP